MTVQTFDPFAIVTVAMDSTVTTLTLSRDASGARRIHEDGPPGTALTLESAVPNFGGCAPSGADIVCDAGVMFRWTVTNSGGSVTPPVRDVVIATSATHGDASPFFDDFLDVRTTSLMEAWLPDGPNRPVFLGSNIATGTPAQPADIVHAGSAGLSSPLAMGGLNAGADVAVGTSGAMTVAGGGGTDTLVGSSAIDTLDGGADSDLIRGGLGQDTLTAGAGISPADVLSYDDAARTAGLSTTFVRGAATTLGTSEDGAGDTVSTGFDVLEGTPVADNLTAGPAGADLRGAGGDDVLQGGAGTDAFAGGDGADNISALDGNAEFVDCGAGLDVTFTFDPSDTLNGCEGPQPVDPGAVPDPGGGAAPAPDGAAPVAGAGVAPVTGAGAGPGTSTGTGTAGTTAKPALPAIGATLTAAFGVRGSSTTVTTLSAKKLPAGATVAITCTAPKGKASACAFKSRTKSFTKATASSAFAALFKKRRLPAKTVVVVRITAPGVSGKVFTFTTRKSKQPTRVTAAA